MFTDRELIEIRTACMGELSKTMSLPFSDDETKAIEERLSGIIGKINMCEPIDEEGEDDEEDDDGWDDEDDEDDSLI